MQSERGGHKERQREDETDRQPMRDRETRTREKETNKEKKRYIVGPTNSSLPYFELFFLLLWRL